jgi:ribosomal 30S subunit maturation factor RimM
MAYRNQILLGRIARVNGYDGYVTVKLEKAFIEDIQEMESVFIETEGRPVPFFITASEYSGGDLLRLKFEGYDAFEKVAEFSGCKIFLTTVSEKKNSRTQSGTCCRIQSYPPQQETNRHCNRVNS